ncbi:MAG: hypothetical protein DMG49_11850 [Acidobacteria bacterium]|nr:MAG: hypothetical protein DMG49_11850 [Acidobacteriota bacterium]
MALISARSISLLLTALAAGVVLGHLMSRVGKVTLPGPLFVTVQNTLYRNWRTTVGAVEIGAFLSTFVVAFLTRRRGAIFALSLAGLLSLAGMLLVWAVFINPINIQVRATTSESPPADWALLRDRWHRLHAIRSIFAVVGLGALISAVLWDCSR